MWAQTWPTHQMLRWEQARALNQQPSAPTSTPQRTACSSGQRRGIARRSNWHAPPAGGRGSNRTRLMRARAPLHHAAHGRSVPVLGIQGRRGRLPGQPFDEKSGFRVTPFCLPQAAPPFAQAPARQPLAAPVSAGHSAANCPGAHQPPPAVHGGRRWAHWPARPLPRPLGAAHCAAPRSRHQGRPPVPPCALAGALQLSGAPTTSTTPAAFPLTLKPALNPLQPPVCA